jgi:hypothetical protein
MTDPHPDYSHGKAVLSVVLALMLVAAIWLATYGFHLTHH